MGKSAHELRVGNNTDRKKKIKLRWFEAGYLATCDAGYNCV